MQDINQLILGDNLEILKKIESNTVDLIYLDPPFFSNRTYEVIWGDSGEVRSFDDRFSGGIDHYISWLKERVIEMHRILKPTGVIFLHCDWHANSYIRVYILDKIFGEKNFLNEILWTYNTYQGQVKTYFAKKHDTIFFYSKTAKYTFHQQEGTNIEESVNFLRWQNYIVDGNKIMGSNYPKTDSRFTQRLDAWKRKNGRDPLPDDVIFEVKSFAIPDYWTDIQALDPKDKTERIGYPTQKPEKLLERIINSASNEGDLILDPFVGGGTTIAVADKLNRRWIGIDQSVQAVKVTEYRLNLQQGLFSSPFIVQLHKYDYDTLRYKDAFEFENFIVTAFGGRPNIKQRGDLGLDGKTTENIPIQVKRSDNIGRNVIDNFLSAIQRSDKKLYDKNIAEKKPAGFIIAFSFGKGATQEVARLKNEENIIIKLVTVEDIIPIAKKPSLTVTISDKGKDNKGLREIDFIAKAKSEAGIEFFSWDFDYKDNKFKAEILLDKTGVQTFKFKAGLHQIAVKVIDNDGLENIEIIKLKVNGIVERQ